MMATSTGAISEYRLVMIQDPLTAKAFSFAGARKFRVPIDPVPIAQLVGIRPDGSLTARIEDLGPVETMVAHVRLFSEDGLEEKPAILRPESLVSKPTVETNHGEKEPAIKVENPPNDEKEPVIKIEGEDAIPITTKIQDEIPIKLTKLELPKSKKLDLNRYQAALDGYTVSPCYLFNSPSGARGAYFCFENLYVGANGYYRLQISLFLPRFSPSANQGKCLASVMSRPFKAWPTMDFPGLPASTKITKSFRAQGLNLHIRHKNSPGLIIPKQA